MTHPGKAPPPPAKPLGRQLGVIYALIAVDAAGAALIFPILPGLLRSMHQANDVATLFGAMLALYALMQFVCAPVLGVLSDRYGRRKVLLLSLAGSVIDYLIMAFTPHVWVLFVGRAIAGLTAATTAVTTAFIADVTPQAERAGRFGLAQAFFGVGFVLGPVIGGMLGGISLRDPFFAAAMLNGANLAAALFVLRESHGPGQGRIDWPMLNPLGPLRWAWTCRALVPLLSVFLLMSLVGQTYGTIWVLFVQDRFRWTTTEIGLSLGMFGALVILAQAFAVRPVIRHLGERGTLLLGIACEAIAMPILAFARAGWIVFAVVPLIAFGGIGLPALRALQSRAADQRHQGQVQGVAASLAGLAAILGPLVFSWIYALSRPGWNGWVWVAGLAIYALAVPLVLALPGKAGGG